MGKFFYYGCTEKEYKRVIEFGFLHGEKIFNKRLDIYGSDNYTHEIAASIPNKDITSGKATKRDYCKHGYILVYYVPDELMDDLYISPVNEKLTFHGRLYNTDLVTVLDVSVPDGVFTVSENKNILKIYDNYYLTRGGIVCRLDEKEIEKKIIEGDDNNGNKEKRTEIPTR